MGAPGRGSGQDRQGRGGAVQRLDLGLLIHAQHQRPLRRVQVEPDDVTDLGDELRIGRQLPGLLQVRLEPERPPDPGDGGLAHPDLPGHRPGRPMGVVVGRWPLQGGHDHLLDLVVGDRAGPARPWLIRQALQPLAHEPTPPLGHRLRPDPQPGGHRDIGRALRAGQHDPRSQGQRLGTGAPPRPALQGLSFLLGQTSGAVGLPRSAMPAHYHLHNELTTQDTSGGLNLPGEPTRIAGQMG